MKNYLFIFLTVFLTACSSKVKPYSGEVNFLYKEAQGTIGVKAVGYGNNQETAVEDAQKNAFKILLFKGIPGTELNIPLIQNESEATSKFSSYFKKFFDDGFYKTYIMSSSESSNLIKMKGYKKISVDIKINYNSLRKDLENNQLIRKFGF
jgi:hypothetical protein